MNYKTEYIETDLLIIGGGTAGCFAALTFCEASAGRVLIAEKADIRRSGCLAAGVNALNAYISEGHTPRDYADYAKADAAGIARDDLLITMAERLNAVTAKLKRLGLTVLKDANGKYVTRGWRNVKINGENIKPLLADAVKSEERIAVLNKVNAFEYIVRDNVIQGAYAVSVDEPVLYAIAAKAVLCATGGAAGLYKPNNPGFSRHKMWYPPFNTGAGYAMGIRAGAEMTGFEMRFIALRCKDTIAPTGTLAQGVGAKQINSLGEVYEDRYGLTTSERLYGTVAENAAGRGPCFLRTVGISKDQDDDLLKAYLNMSPSQTLKWVESGKTPSLCNVEIEGTEPYITGGHTASGYWVDVSRATTVKGLFAAGDVAGGCPQKYVTGALAEGEIAAKAAADYIENTASPPVNPPNIADRINAYFNNPDPGFTADDLEAEMQSVMDEYAGGIGRNYEYSEASLKTALQKIERIEEKSRRLKAADPQELVYILELLERLTVCKTLIAHLSARKETRWRSFAENVDYPGKNPDYDCHINSVYENGEIKIIKRGLI